MTGWRDSRAISWLKSDPQLWFLLLPNWGCGAPGEQATLGVPPKKGARGIVGFSEVTKSPEESSEAPCCASRVGWASDVSDWRGDEHVCWNSPFLRSGYRRGQCDSDLYPLLQRATLNDGTATAKLIAFEHAHPVPPLAPSGRCVVPSNSSIGQTTTPGRLKKTELGQEVQCDPFAAQSRSNTHQTPHRPVL